MSTTLRCAWCGRPIGDESSSEADSPAVSHGICLHCAESTGVFPVADLRSAPQEALDSLPFGVIEIDHEGRIVSYNAWEEELAGTSRSEVIGRRFFEEVAPCTCVQEFRGRWARLKESDSPGHEQFEFIFKFEDGSRLVDLRFAYSPGSETTLLLVQAMD